MLIKQFASSISDVFDFSAANFFNRNYSIRKASSLDFGFSKLVDDLQAQLIMIWDVSADECTSRCSQVESLKESLFLLRFLLCLVNGIVDLNCNVVIIAILRLFRRFLGNFRLRFVKIVEKLVNLTDAILFLTDVCNLKV